MYLTIQDLAERFRVQPNTIYHWRIDGYGPPSVRIRQRVLYRLADVERWEQEQAEHLGARVAV